MKACAECNRLNEILHILNEVGWIYAQEAKAAADLPSELSGLSEVIQCAKDRQFQAVDDFHRHITSHRGDERLELLMQQLDRTHAAHLTARDQFHSFILEKPDGMPHPAGMVGIRQEESVVSAALLHYVSTLEEFMNLAVPKKAAGQSAC